MLNPSSLTGFTGIKCKNCRLRLKKANKAAKASKNRKRFRKSIIIRSAFSSWFHLHISMVPANNKTLAKISDVEVSSIAKKIQIPFWQCQFISLRQTHEAIQVGNNIINKSVSCLHPSYEINYISTQQNFQVNKNNAIFHKIKFSPANMGLMLMS